MGSRNTGRALIPLHKQLREQLRLLIVGGTLSPGQKLPGVRELAGYLSINRHTISRALHELEAEGLLEAQQGLGTFVAKNLPRDARKEAEELLRIARRSVQEALALGLSVDELAAAILATDVSSKDPSPNVSIGFVECNPISLEHYASDLRSQLGVGVEPMLISDLRRQVDARTCPFGQCRLVVTTLGHLPEVQRILRDGKEIFPITVGPYLQVFLDVLALPDDHRVGIVTASARGSLGMKHSMIQAGFPAKRLHLASLERQKHIAEVARSVDALVVSSVAMQVVRPLLPNPSLRLIEYRNVLDQTGVEALKERLRDVCTEKVGRSARGLAVDAMRLRRALSRVE